MTAAAEEAAPPRPRLVAAFDPGRNVGHALVDGEGRLIRRAIVDLRAVPTLPVPADAEVVLGAGTGRAALRAALEARGLRVREVDEHGTTLVARELWRAASPARGAARLLPSGLRAPPGPIDDYAAWAIALRYLGLERPT